MHLLYTDETAMDPAQCPFLLYGGLAVPSDTAAVLHRQIEKLRSDAGIASEVLLKFNPCPEPLDHAAFRGLKQAVLEAAAECGCTLVLSIIHHGIVRDGDTNEARRNSINTVFYHFDCLMQIRNDFGVVLIDRFDDPQINAHLREKFAVGLRDMPYSAVMRLKRLIGCHVAAIGQSHFSSVVDIALGSLRWCIQAHCDADETRSASAGELVRLLSPLMHRHPNDSRVSEIGFWHSPKQIKAPMYRDRYRDLNSYLAERGVERAQPVLEG